MKKRVVITLGIIGGVFGVALVIGLCILGIRSALEDARRRSTADVLLVISMELARTYREAGTLTEAQTDDRIRGLVKSGMVTVAYNAQQRPIDDYGTPFRLRHTVEGRLHRVTATSAGPDRRFDTPDDISRDATWETLTPEKR